MFKVILSHVNSVFIMGSKSSSLRAAFSDVTGSPGKVREVVEIVKNDVIFWKSMWHKTMIYLSCDNIDHHGHHFSRGLKFRR